MNEQQPPPPPAKTEEVEDPQPTTSAEPSVSPSPPSEDIEIVYYQDESQLEDINRLITATLSEPYSVYTYRYFLHNWPRLCLIARFSATAAFVGVVVCRLERNSDQRTRGYVAMLAVDDKVRRRGVGTRLVEEAVYEMQQMGADEVYLETEVTNTTAIRLYGNLGFIKERRLLRYYLNGVDAFRLKLYLTSPPSPPAAVDPGY